jgi:uncharacterized coiled-coil protein SlyX
VLLQVSSLTEADVKAKATIAILEANIAVMSQSISQLSATKAEHAQRIAAFEVEVQGLRSTNALLGGKFVSLQEKVTESPALPHLVIYSDQCHLLLYTVTNAFLLFLRFCNCGHVLRRMRAVCPCAIQLPTVF